MPDLGRYGFEVGLAYIGSLALIAALIWVSVVQSRRARKLLAETEERRGNA